MLSRDITLVVRWKMFIINNNHNQLFECSWKAYKYHHFDYTIMHCLICAETNLGGEVMSAFVFPLATIAHFNCHWQCMCDISYVYIN